MAETSEHVANGPRQAQGTGLHYKEVNIGVDSIKSCVTEYPAHLKQMIEKDALTGACRT